MKTLLETRIWRTNLALLRSTHPRVSTLGYVGFLNKLLEESGISSSGQLALRKDCSNFDPASNYCSCPSRPLQASFSSSNGMLGRSPHNPASRIRKVPFNNGSQRHESLLSLFLASPTRTGLPSGVILGPQVLTPLALSLLSPLTFGGSDWE